MRIPKRVNAAWDWAERHARLFGMAVVVLAMIAGVLWLPALAALAVGTALGGLLVHRRLSRRLAGVRAENDDLLREVGALHHQILNLKKGIKAEASVMTQQLPFIPEAED